MRYITICIAQSRVKQEARTCTNDFWIDLSTKIQAEADIGNIRGMYKGITKACGLMQGKRAPLKTKSCEIIKNKIK